MYILEHHYWKNTSLTFISIIVKDNDVLPLVSWFSCNKLAFKAVFPRTYLLYTYMGLQENLASVGVRDWQRSFTANFWPPLKNTWKREMDCSFSPKLVSGDRTLSLWGECLPIMFHFLIPTAVGKIPKFGNGSQCKKWIFLFNRYLDCEQKALKAVLPAISPYQINLDDVTEVVVDTERP